LVSELNVLDQELYDRTATSFQRSIDADLSFDRELRRLRLAKTVYRPWGNLTQTLRRRVRSKIPGV
jgi:hypothetical protein